MEKFSLFACRTDFYAHSARKSLSFQTAEVAAKHVNATFLRPGLKRPTLLRPADVNTFITTTAGLDSFQTELSHKSGAGNKGRRGYY